MRALTGTIMLLAVGMAMSRGTISSNNLRQQTGTITQAEQDKNCGKGANHGALVSELGASYFIEAEFLINVSIPIHNVIETNLFKTMKAGITILKYIKQIGSNFSWLSKLRLYSAAKSVGNKFFEITREFSEEFLDELNLGNRTILQERWRQACLRTIFGKNATTAMQLLEREEAQVSNRDEAIIALTSEVKNFYRTRRGLIDGGGKLLKSIFGVATEQDIKNQNIKIAISKEEILVEMAQGRKIVQEALLHLDQITRELNANILKFTEHEIVLQIAEKLMNIKEILNSLHSIVQEATEKRTMLENGIFADILKRSELRNVIDHGEKELKGMKFHIPHIDDEVSMREALKVISITKTNDRNLFVLGIPFVRKDGENRLFYIKPFPTKSNGQMVTVKNNNEYLLLNGNTYSALSNIDDCVMSYKIRVCKKHRPEESLLSPSCTLGLVKNNITMIKNECHYQLLQRGVYTARIGDNWLVYLNRSSVGTISCPNERNRQLQRLHHMFCVNAPCSLQTPEITLRTTQRGFSETSKRLHLMSVESTDELVIQENTEKKTVRLHQELKSEIQNLSQLHNTHITTSGIITYSGTGVGIIIVMLVTILGLVACLKFRDLLRQVRQECSSGGRSNDKQNMLLPPPPPVHSPMGSTLSILSRPQSPKRLPVAMPRKLLNEKLKNDSDGYAIIERKAPEDEDGYLIMKTIPEGERTI